jgi:DnaJ-class molecular chaperone
MDGLIDRKRGLTSEMHDNFDPERYGMLFCIECEGNGKLLSDSDDTEICPKCGGFGFIKKEEEPDKKKNSKVIHNK